MITKRHHIAITVEGNELDFFSQDQLNLRMNKTVSNPEKIGVTQSEYSFSFTVPKSGRNCEIFDYANMLSKGGKFAKKYNCVVYADGKVIFQGTLLLTNVTDTEFKCNLVSVKNSSTDEIFGDDTMSGLKWEIGYTGTDTQNAYNEQDDPDLFFPLVCYGAFQKEPSSVIRGETTELKNYTSLYLLDKYVKWYNQSFIPSPKLIEIIKRMITAKGYTYSGDAFNDELINKIYLSSYLDTDQVPNYNYGSNLGKLKVDFNFNSYDTNSNYPPTYIRRDLRYPEDLLQQYWTDWYQNSPPPADEALIYPMLNNGDNSLTLVDNYDMWEDGFVVIPSTGWYKIILDCSVTIMDSEGNRNRWWVKTTRGQEYYYDSETKPLTLDYFPVECHLVKTNELDLEFIAGQRDFQRNQSHSEMRYTYWTMLPHETQSNDPEKRGYYTVPYADEYQTRCYDRYANDNFICGVSSAASSCAIVKRDRSWQGENTTNNKSNFNSNGYNLEIHDASGTHYETQTDYHKHNDADIPECHFERPSGKTMNGMVYCYAWLEKNDMLSLYMLTKDYADYTTGESPYERKTNQLKFHAYGNLRVEAFSPKEKDIRRSWNADSAYSKNLNIGEFLNRNEKQSEFFTNFLTTFNLQCNVSGKNIEISKNAKGNAVTTPLELDDRVRGGETERINYPTSVEVAFTIDEDESGFYHSVPSEHINDDDWKDYGDRGYEKIILDSEPYTENAISKTSKFSHDWMMDFKLTDCYTKSGTDYIHNTDYHTLSMPIIAKDEDFIDGLDYEEMMAKDGRSLKQRMFFKSPTTPYYVPNRNGARYSTTGELQSAKMINVCLATNLYKTQEVLRYEEGDGKLLDRYFTVSKDTNGNYYTVEAYLTPEEYVMLNGGCDVRVDSDIYTVVSLTGYDPSGNNRTKIKLMRKD